MNSRSWELRELCYKATEKIFHENHYGVMKPLLEMFNPKPPPSPEVKTETLVTPPPKI